MMSDSTKVSLHYKLRYALREVCFALSDLRNTTYLILNYVASTAYLNCTCAMNKKQANDNVMKREGQTFQRDKNWLATYFDIPRSLHGNR